MWDKVRCGTSVISGRWISNCRTGYPGHGRRRFLPGSFPPSWHPSQLGRKNCVLPSPSREGPQNHGTLWLRADSVGEVAGGLFRRHTSSSDPTACQLVDVLVWARVVLVLTGTAVTSCLRLHRQTKGCRCKDGRWPHGDGDTRQLPQGGQLGASILGAGGPRPPSWFLPRPPPGPPPWPAPRPLPWPLATGGA